MWACRHFHPYLAGRHFTLHTDHQPLTSLNRVQGQALRRLCADLDEFKPFTIQYMKGTAMPADGLSRLEEVEGTEARAIPPVVMLDQVHYLQKSDKWIKALACFFKI